MKLKNKVRERQTESLGNHARVFLSYSTQDFAEVSKFKEMLNDRWPTWYLHEHPVKESYDQNWKIHCERKIKNSNAMICLVGWETHKSTAIRWEILQAKNFGVPTLAVYLKSDPPYPPTPEGLDSVSFLRHESISTIMSMIK